MKQIASGEVEGIPVLHGLMAQLINTAAVEHVEHLKDVILPEAPLADLLLQSCVLTLAGEHTHLLPSDEIAIALETNVSALEARLNTASNLYEQIAVLTKLVELNSIDAQIHIYNQQRSLRDLIEEVYTQAGRLRLWSVLRQATGLQGKIDGDIGLAVGDLLVAQKFIQVGRSYHDGSLITRPIGDEELMQRIVQYCREDVRDQILTQEVLLYLGILIKARPELFSELLTVRASLLIILLTSQIARTQDCHTDEAYEILMDMPPSEVQSRLEAVLENYQHLAGLPQKMEALHAHGDTEQLSWQQNLGLEQLDTPAEGWLAWRQHQGIIDRRSSDFLSKVWRILQHTSGLVIGNQMDKRNRINSSLVLSDMTQGEKAFALLIEHMFNNIQAAEYRQLSIETLNALSSFFEQNPTLIIDDAIIIDVTIGHAVNLAYIAQYPEKQDNYQEHKSHAWERFYEQSPVHSTTYIISALNHLLTITTAKNP
jgi:phosphorylase kinase alpha/beta subunit